MSFMQVVEQVKSSQGDVFIDESWAQGRASYGGLVAALVYQAMSNCVSPELPVRSLQINFVGPVAPGNLSLSSELLRSGKSVTSVLGRGEQDEQTKVAVIGSFGRSRASSILVTAPTKAFSEKPENLDSMPFEAGVMPEFTKHFDFRYATPYPFTGTSETCLRGYVRLKSPGADYRNVPVDISVLLALIDAWPPTVLPMLDVPAPASSLSWNVEFVQPLPALGLDEFCYYEAEIVHAKDGYAATSAKVWNADGQLLASSQQTVVAFA